MSGTSLDGISACVVRFSEPGKTDGSLSLELLAFDVKEYSHEQRERLLAAMQGATAQEYCRLAFDLGTWLAEAAQQVMVESGVPREEIRAIGSHGQTLWHEAPHSTLQTGESAVIAARLGLGVAGALRVRDVAAGGQAPPLVPIAA